MTKLATMELAQTDLKDFLDEKYLAFNTEEFIITDPIQVPRRFSFKEDIEIAGFLSATLAWGQRPSIIRNANQLMSLMDDAPFDFIQNFKEGDLKRFTSFKHRTYNGEDCMRFMQSLQNIYHNHGGLEAVLNHGYSSDQTIFSALKHFREVFFEVHEPNRTEKHVANVEKGSAAKRINMFLRWMVRNDNFNVDFGLWKNIPASALMMPLDVHTGNVGRKLGLLQRKQNDWKAVVELTGNLSLFDAEDPVKYDFALFGLGVFEKF